MGRVLDALQRQQEEEEVTSDPLAASVGVPEAAPDQGGANGLAAAARIGAPAAAKSNEGAPLAFLFDEGRDEWAGLDAQPDWPGAVGRSNQASANGARHAELTPFEPAATPPAGLRARALRETVEPQVYNTAEIDFSRLHTRLVLYTDPHAPGCEQYRTLRTQIFHAAERQPTQVIVLTSAVAGEGKTSTTLNLAWAIAQSKEKRVLVIDSDLRRPSVSSYLGLRGALGLSEVVEDERDVLSCVVQIAGHSLYVLASNREEAHPTELLSRERVGEMLEELRQYFDYILIDAPPVVPFADARLLANHADAIIMVVRAGLAGHNTIERAIEALPANRILGVILNGADQISEVGYYGYYGYGYNYARGRRGRFDWRSLLRLGRGGQAKQP
jgi:protein-tyrosine kinase